MKTNIIKAAIFTPASRGRWGLPLLAWSKPGEGKSAILREVCEGFGLPLVVLSPGEMGEGAFGVIPIPTKEGVIRYPPPEWVSTVASGGLVFIDEVTCAPPAIQPAILGLTLDARIGFTTLHPRVRRIAAANPPEYAANGYDLNPAQANRFGHLEWTAPTVDEHQAYMMRGSTGHEGNGHEVISAPAEEERVLAAWGGAWARAVGLETAFLRAAPHLKNQCPKAGQPQASRAWPSDRSWENATRALASAQVHGLSPTDTDEFVAAFIGEAVYAEWRAFIQAQDLPDAVALLDGGRDASGKVVTFTHSNARVDRTVAVLNACVALVTPEHAPKREARAAALWDLIEALFSGPNVGQDLCIAPAEQLLAARLAGQCTDPKVRAAYSRLARQPKFSDLIRAGRI